LFAGNEEKFIIVILVLFSGLVLLSFFLIWLFVSRQRIIYLSKNRELEMIAMRSQMNPHFIFNCLSTINDFVIRSDRERSSNYLAKFAKLIRLILNNSRATFVVFEDELTALRLYLELEEMRFGPKFSYQIVIAPDIESLKMEVPSMIIQPYIENSIWHGVRQLPGGGSVFLNFKLKGRYLVCIIEDNGIGQPGSHHAKTSNENEKFFEIHGTQIAEDRLSQMVKMGHKMTAVNILDLKGKEGNNTGTRVELTLPVKLRR